MITANQIKIGQRFELHDGTVFEITALDTYKDNTPAVRARMLPDTVSNYMDTLEDTIEILNEEGAFPVCTKCGIGTPDDLKCISHDCNRIEEV